MIEANKITIIVDRDDLYVNLDGDATTDGTSMLVPAGTGYTEDGISFKEHQYSASSIPAFTAFQLKVTLTGTNSSYPPLIKDMRGIALAV